MTRFASVGLIIAFTSPLAGCATLVNGRTLAIPISSNALGAQVAIDSVPVGTTPLVASVSRRSSHIVTITYDTFPAYTVTLEKRISPWLWTNALYFMVPAAVDRGIVK